MEEEKIIYVTLITGCSVFSLICNPTDENQFYTVFQTLIDFCNRLKEFKIIEDFYIKANTL